LGGVGSAVVAFEPSGEQDLPLVQFEEQIF
jgi:hypothetical protein